MMAVFERTFQIHRVYEHVFKKGKLVIVLVSMFKIGGGVAIIFGIQLVILITWTIIDPYNSTSLTVNSSQFQQVWTCHSNFTQIWMGLEVAFFGVLLMWAIYVVYSTWVIKNTVVESRWILISMYNNLLLLGLVTAIFTTFGVDLQEQTMYSIIAPAIILCTTNTSIAFYLPFVLLKLKIIITTSGNTLTSGELRESKSETSKVTTEKMEEVTVEQYPKV